MPSIWVRQAGVRLEHRPKAKPPEDDGSGSFAAYSDYNKTLRAWFVAFGVGGPALFLVNENVAHKLAEAGELTDIALLFLIGATAQIVCALINKTANWLVYRSTWGDEESSYWRYRAANWLSEQFLIDLGLDLITVVTYGMASWLLLMAFAK